MTDQRDHDEEEPEFDELHGPSQADIDRYGRDESEYLDYRKSEARSAFWKLIAGAVFILIAASMVLNVLLPALRRSGNEADQPARVAALVSRVFDPRTIAVRVDGVEQTVRYIGLDGPAFGDPLYDVVVSANIRLLQGQEVLLEADEIDADSQGRLLRYVWYGDRMVNLDFVASGFSRADIDGANDRYRISFAEAERIARENQRGIWADEDEDAERSVESTVPDEPLDRPADAA